MRLAILLLIAALTGVIGCNANVLPSYTELPASEAPVADTGTIHRYRVHSQQLDDDIIIDVWTPQSYNTSGDIRYPVIYAHDGQNLFDQAMSFTGVVWELDKCMGDLIQNDEIVAPIVVGITNRSALRPADYFPQKAIDYIADSDRPLTRIFNTCSNGFYGDRHASFVATELKPLIDHLYLHDAEGAGHNELSWQQRVHLPLRFILSKNRPELSGIDTMTASTMLSDHTTAIYTALGQYTHYSIGPLSAAISPGLYIVTTPGNISRKLLIK